MKIVVLSFKIVPAARPPVRPPSARPPSARPPVRPSARSGAGRTYIHKTPDRPPWAAVTRKFHVGPSISNTTAEKPQMVFLFKGEKFRQLAVCLLVLLRILARAIAEPRLNKFYKELLSLFVSHIIGNSVQDFQGPVIIH